MGLFDWLKPKKPRNESSLINDARRMSQWVVQALLESGYLVDFSVESLREIDRFFDEHACDGEPIAGGLLTERFGARMFALGAYVGECILRAKGGSWEADDDDPEGEINIRVVLPDGSVIWPVQRVIKRLQNGSSDGIYVYCRVLSDNP
jgi:hypothetical protein